MNSPEIDSEALQPGMNLGESRDDGSLPASVRSEITAGNQADDSLGAKSERRNYDRLLRSQRVFKGLLVGLVAALVCGVVWAAVSVLTDRQIGYAALGLGAAVGYATCKFGRGIKPVFGFAAAVAAFVGCFVGHFLSGIGFLAGFLGIGYFETLATFDYSELFELMVATLAPLDILFYLLAISTAFKMGFTNTPAAQPADCP